MNFISFCSGLDLFGYGMRKAGHTQVGHAEIDKWSNLLNEEYNNSKGENYGCLRKLAENPHILPDFEIASAGLPCPAFSIAGRRTANPFDQKSIGGDLFRSFCRIIEFKEPKILFLEQVKGVLSSGKEKGDTFREILHRLSELGYDCQWQVLNSKNFGVPQNRERVFIIGHLRGTSRPEVFPILGESCRHTTVGITAETAVARTISAGGNSGGNHSGMTILQLNNPKHSNNRLYDKKGISPTLNACGGGSRQPFIKEPYEKDPDHPYPQIRRLTPLEFFRLQGAPDDMYHKGVELGISDTQLYKMAGNSVTVPVIEAIAKKLV